MIDLRGIVKSFPGVRALRGVDFEVIAGEVHALVGENGAGKSTLMNVLAGVLAPDAGQIVIDGRPEIHLDPARAHKLGIGFVRQEPAVVPELSILENMTLGVESRTLGMVERRSSHGWALECLRRMRLTMDPAQLVERLSISQRHLLDVAKTLFFRPRIMIMDEPTATLTPTEAEWLFDVIGEQTRSGHCVIYISHRLEEVFRLADRISVLRDGSRVGTVTPGRDRVDEDGLISMMVGRELAAAFPERDRGPREGRPEAAGGSRSQLRVAGLLREIDPAEPDLVVQGGEILAVAGLVGSGRTELVEGLFGVRRLEGVTVVLDGATVDLDSPAAAVEAGIGLVPEDRRRQGLIGIMSVADNLTLSVPHTVSRRGWVFGSRVRAVANHYIRELDIKVAGPDQEVRTLSGGNQQKVVIAKWIARDSRVFIFDEPTQGVDVGARVEVYRQITALAAAGKIVIVVSSEMSEVLGLSDRILVMREGRPVALLETGGATEEQVLRAAFGRSAA